MATPDTKSEFQCNFCGVQFDGVHECERDALKAECERLRGEVDRLSYSSYAKVAIDLEKERDALKAEVERLLTLKQQICLLGDAVAKDLRQERDELRAALAVANDLVDECRRYFVWMHEGPYGRTPMHSPEILAGIRNYLSTPAIAAMKKRMELQERVVEAVAFFKEHEHTGRRGQALRRMWAALAAMEGE